MQSRDGRSQQYLTKKAAFMCHGKRKVIYCATKVPSVGTDDEIQDASHVWDTPQGPEACLRNTGHRHDGQDPSRSVAVQEKLRVVA